VTALSKKPTRLVSPATSLPIPFPFPSTPFTSAEGAPISIEVGDHRPPPEIGEGAVRLQEEPKHYLIALGSQGGEEPLPLHGAEGLRFSAEVGGMIRGREAIARLRPEGSIRGTRAAA